MHHPRFFKIFSVSSLKIRKKIFTLQYTSLRPMLPLTLWLSFHVGKRCEFYTSENVTFHVEICSKLIVLCWRKLLFLKTLIWNGYTDTSCLGNDLLIGYLKLGALTLRLFSPLVCIHGLWKIAICSQPKANDHLLCARYIQGDVLAKKKNNNDTVRKNNAQIILALLY